MAKEYFWGATLSKDKKVYKWDPESEFQDDEEDMDDNYSISHFLFLKQAVLGAEVEDTERNVVEVETVDFDGEKVKQPLFSLKLGLNESTTLDMGLQPPVTFKLVKGSGPVFLSGQHALDLQDDFEEDREELTSDEDIDEKEEEEEEMVKKVSTKGKDKKKAVIKDVKVPKKGKGDELDDDEEDEDEDDEDEEEEEKQTGKGKKRPAPSAKGPAKKLAKVDKDGKSKKKVSNGSVENGLAENDDDDDDDEEDEDYKVDDEEDEEEATSGEEEEDEDEEMALGDDDDEDDDEEDDEDEDDMDDEDDEEDEDEEEESSPEKPAKKAKGKVNGTVKSKGTPKSQSKSKEKKTYTTDDIKQDLIKSPSKPKKEDKFKNFVKSRFHLSDAKKIQELWGWYKSTQLK